MGHRRSRHLARRMRLPVACLLVFVGIFGFAHAVRAARAQRIYLGVKYGYFQKGTPELRASRIAKPPVTDAREAIVLFQRARGFYSSNYYFPVYVAQLCLAEASAATDRKTFRDSLDAALYFSREAVSLNPYNDEARHARVEALERDGQIAEALAFWEEVVEREYWTLEHHDTYARLLLREGSDESLQKAVRERGLVRDADLRRRLEKLARFLKS